MLLQCFHTGKLDQAVLALRHAVDCVTYIVEGLGLGWLSDGTMLLVWCVCMSLRLQKY